MKTAIFQSGGVSFTLDMTILPFYNSSIISNSNIWAERKSQLPVGFAEANTTPKDIVKSIMMKNA